jgi:hypothetical protein
MSSFEKLIIFSKSKNPKFKKMNKELIYDLFERTTKYRQPKKESLSELRDCYERYSLEYISALDFLKELNNLGFPSNSFGEVKLRMKKNVRKIYFTSG